MSNERSDTLLGVSVDATDFAMSAILQAVEGKSL
jgi:hypothetical protein